MRQSYARAAARRETTDQFNARMAARTAPVKPWGKILSVEETEASRADERAEMNLDQFTQAEQMALMQASHEHRHQHIWHRLRRNFEVPPFTLSTFRSLAERGLTEKPEGKTFHTLTAEGARIADAIAGMLVEEHDLHLAWIGSHIRATATVHCTCKWSAGIRYGENTQANAIREHSRHLREIGKA